MAPLSPIFVAKVGSTIIREISDTVTLQCTTLDFQQIFLCATLHVEVNAGFSIGVFRLDMVTPRLTVDATLATPDTAMPRIPYIMHRSASRQETCASLQSLAIARQVTEAAASYRKERKDEDTTAKTGLTQEEYLSGFRKEEGESVNMWAVWENGINQARNDGYADGESKGWDSAMVSNIKNLMETSGWDARQTMDALKIPASEQEKYAKQL